MVVRGLSRVTKEYVETGSSNDEMHRLLEVGDLEEGMVVRTDYQSAGKGHRGNTWSSEPGKNLLFSILLKPDFLPLASAFQLSRIISLSLVDVIDRQGIRTSIKWPNDILSNSKKISGILIENSIVNGRISHAVVGVGLNVNQEVFDDSIPAPTSMTLEKECHFDMKLLLDDFRTTLESWYTELKSGEIEKIEHAYLNRLYLLGKPSNYSDANGKFVACIKGVLPEGELELVLKSGEIRRYGFKEVEFRK
jgi:BirA family transcriptional regulator, biotin operon repressor / biotin---[acetyl-CoA-carboxylase] ligase